MLFNKRPPAWARGIFADAKSCAAFERCVADWFAGQGIGVRIADGNAEPVSGLDTGAYGALKFGLTNIAQACRAMDRAEWAGAIAEHFGAVVSQVRNAGADDGALDSIESAREFLVVRTLNQGDHADDVWKSAVWVEGPGRTRVLVAAQFGNVMKWSLRSRAQRWGVDDRELLKAAISNTKAKLDAAASWERFESPTQTPLFALSGETRLVASSMIWVHEIGEVNGPNGCLFAIPVGDLLIASPVEDELPDTLAEMITHARTFHGEGPAPITDEIFWACGKKRYPVGIKDVAGKGIEVDLPGALRRALWGADGDRG